MEAILLSFHKYVVNNKLQWQTESAIPISEDLPPVTAKHLFQIDPLVKTALQKALSPTGTWNGWRLYSVGEPKHWEEKGAYRDSVEVEVIIVRRRHRDAVHGEDPDGGELVNRGDPPRYADVSR